MARLRPALLRTPLPLPPGGHAPRTTTARGLPVAVPQVHRSRDAALDAFARRHPGTAVGAATLVGSADGMEFITLAARGGGPVEIVEVELATLRARVLPPEEAAWFTAGSED